MNFFKIFFATFLAMIATTIAILIYITCVIVGVVMGSGVIPEVKSGSVLTINLAEPIIDTPEVNPWDSFDITTMTVNPNLSLLSVLRSIERATYDDNIKGIYIRPSSSGTAPISIANLAEIRTAIEQFKKDSDKFVIAYGDTFSQGDYYLASVADKLYLQPEGMVVWQGVAVNSLYFKKLIDGVGVNVEVFRPEACTYKSAVEPFIRNNMSPESRQQNEDLITSIWGSITEDVASSRRVAASSLNHAATNLSGFIAKEAVDAGLVDELKYEDEVESIIDDMGVKRTKNDNLRKVSLANYIASNESLDIVTEKSTTHAVAVIYAEGTIVDGAGELGDVGSSKFVAQLRRARENDNIKAVVVRVNSPGGSALASDVIWREMSLLRDEKPLLVSMGAYAASGGYYMSAPADAIVASRFTITGSIGVYGMLADVQKALSQHLGISSDGVKSNPSADFMRSSRPITATERAVMMRSVDQVYDTFTQHVSDGRNIPLSKVMSVAKGRVWSGTEAKEIGLVDGVMGLKGAILMAANRAGISDKFDIVEVLDESSGFAALFSTTSAKVMDILTRGGAGNLQLLDNIKILESKGVNAYSPLRVDWR